MKRFIQKIRDIFSIEDLRVRILNTIGFLLIYRLGSFIVLPGVDPDKLDGELDGIFGLIAAFTGGAFTNASIFALGVMPYITASIILQLLGVAVPYFKKMQSEGESGRKKINQITRVLTIIICMFQAPGYLSFFVRPEAISPEVSGMFFTVSSMFILTAGTVFCMWLGEKITDKGIGNGISMLIMIGIISRLPISIFSELGAKSDKLFMLVIEFLVLFFIFMVVVMFTQATRRIPVQYAKQVVGNKVYGGQRQFLPLKVNAAGVMPIIFAQSVMFLPAIIAGVWSDKSDTAAFIQTSFNDIYSAPYNIVFALMIIIFTFFYTAITINPTQIADDMKRNGGFIPGVKPGKDTSEFIDNVLSRITLPGALFVGLIAVLPAIAAQDSLLRVDRNFAQFFGGTSLLIMVGVVLDTLQQVESYLLMRHYEGMMKSGKLKGRSDKVAVA